MGNPVHSPFAALHAYELRHLPAHLVDSGQGNTLHRLLALEVPEGHNAWYARKHANGDVSGFLADINLGWRIAEQSSRESIYLTRAASHIALELRYALILASINSVSSSLPPSLLGPLVAASAWPVEQALTFARRYVDWSKRVRALACLAPSLAAAGRTDDLREAIAQTLGPAG